MKPTKEQFHAYIKVRNSGKTNMMDGTMVQILAWQMAKQHLSVEHWKYIIARFDELKEEYGEG
jgi:hypothetical protein